MPWIVLTLSCKTHSIHDWEFNKVSSNFPLLNNLTTLQSVFCSRIAIDPIFLPPPIPNSKRHQIPDALDNKYELVFNEKDDAAALKNLPIDDTMHDII